VNMLSRLFKSWRLHYVLIAVIAFSLGGATVVQAVAPGGILGVVRLADGTDDTHLAAVDASGNVGVKVSNFPATQPVSGTVGVVGSPTVELTRQTLLADGSGDFNPVPRYFDVSSYEKVRITAASLGVCGGSNVFVYVIEEPAANTLHATTLDSFVLACGEVISRLYDVPGTWLRLVIKRSGTGDPGPTLELAIYGHR
jgi:hypothetical protein